MRGSTSGPRSIPSSNTDGSARRCHSLLMLLRKGRKGGVGGVRDVAAAAGREGRETEATLTTALLLLSLRPAPVRAVEERERRARRRVRRLDARRRVRLRLKRRDPPRGVRYASRRVEVEHHGPPLRPPRLGQGVLGIEANAIRRRRRRSARWQRLRARLLRCARLLLASQGTPSSRGTLAGGCRARIGVVPIRRGRRVWWLGG